MENGETVTQIKRFDATTESKLLKSFLKMFSQENGINEEDAIKKDSFALMTVDNCVMAIGKTEQAKRFLSRFIDNEAKEYNKIPDLFGGNMESGKTKISIIYLNRILKIFDSFSDESGLIIQTSKDYPVTIENEHLKFIIAPRIDND